MTNPYRNILISRTQKTRLFYDLAKEKYIETSNGNTEHQYIPGIGYWASFVIVLAVGRSIDTIFKLSYDTFIIMCFLATISGILIGELYYQMAIRKNKKAVIMRVYEKEEIVESYSLLRGALDIYIKILSASLLMVIIALSLFLFLTLAAPAIGYAGMMMLLIYLLLIAIFAYCLRMAHLYKYLMYFIPRVEIITEGGTNNFLLKFLTLLRKVSNKL